VGTLAELVRGQPALVAANAPLRQQALILRRSGKRPRRTPADRALLIVQPGTLLRRQRQGFRRFGRRKARSTASPTPKVADETIALIREIAAANRPWGAERIRVSKRTIQKGMRQVRPPRPSGQPWATFLRNHATEIVTARR